MTLPTNLSFLTGDRITPLTPPGIPPENDTSGELCPSPGNGTNSHGDRVCLSSMQKIIPGRLSRWGCPCWGKWNEFSRWSTLRRLRREGSQRRLSRWICASSAKWKQLWLRSTVSVESHGNQPNKSLRLKWFVLRKNERILRRSTLSVDFAGNGPGDRLSPSTAPRRLPEIDSPRWICTWSTKWTQLFLRSTLYRLSRRNGPSWGKSK